MSDTPWGTLAASITRLWDALSEQPVFREASISGLSPLSVRFDTDTVSTTVLGSLSSSHTVGDRVMTMQLRRYVWVLGTKRASTKGTTAQRDAQFGSPTTDAQRVALANQKVTWFNTDLGWAESYYAPTGLSGLTAPALVAGSAAGWYPVGEGPMIRLISNGTQNVNGSGQTITAWALPGTGLSFRRGGTDYFTYSAGIITCVRAGRYRIGFKTRVQSGSGSAWIYLDTNAGGIDMMYFTLTSVFQVVRSFSAGHLVSAGGTVRAFSDTGSYNLNEAGNGANPTSGEFIVEYMGPPLVSN